METNSSIDAKVALTTHRLLSCNVVGKCSPEEATGGALEITTMLGALPHPGLLTQGSIYSIVLRMKAVGKIEEADKVAFSAEAHILGEFVVIDCDPAGVQIEDDLKVLETSARQLSPLLSQFVTEILFKMGFQGVLIPPLNTKGFERMDELEGKRTGKGKVGKGKVSVIK